MVIKHSFIYEDPNLFAEKITLYFDEKYISKNILKVRMRDLYTYNNMVLYHDRIKNLKVVLDGNYLTFTKKTSDFDFNYTYYADNGYEVIEEFVTLLIKSYNDY